MSISERSRDTKPLFSFPFVALICSLTIVSALSAQSESVYVDSHERFTIQIPAGWVAKPYSAWGASGVTIIRGQDSYVQVFLQKGVDPASFLKALNNGIQATHPGYSVLDQGSRTVAGQSRMFIVGESPETPNLSRARVYLETFSANGFSYAITAFASGKNSPGRDLMSDYKISQGMIQSLTLNAAPPKSSNAAVVTPARAASHVAPVPRPTDAVSVALSSKDLKTLAALDAALKGRAISEEEYQIKKSALYSSALTRQNTSALRKALNQAYEDGILTKDEYDRKKDSLRAEVPFRSGSQDPIPDSGVPPLKPMEVFAAKYGPQPEPLPKSWITHNDPAGFVVNLPAAWTVDKANSSGQVVLRGTRGEEVLIWPLHLEHTKLETEAAAVLVQALARKFDVLMPWSAVQTTQNATRVTGLGADRSGTAVLSWANSPTAASVYFYGIEAPGEVYSASTDTFVAILKSFHVVQDSSVGELKFVNWTDPHESAFSVSVPQGWRAIGGAYRISGVDARHSVVMSSPDGQVRASMGDSMVGAFTQPTPALARAGLAEGNYETLDDGTKLEILRFNSGEQFARSYVETLVSSQCRDPQINSNNSRGDLASAFSQATAKEGFADVLFTAGEVSFTCDVDGRPVKGKYIAATIRMAPGFSPMWFVYRLYGYIAFAGRERDGEKVLAQMLQSAKFDLDWETRQSDAANAATHRDNERSRQIRENALQNIAEDQRQTSEMIANANEQRQKFYAQIDRKRENSVLGRLDVVDSGTGTVYKISGFGDYHYLSNDGYIYSTNSLDAPGSNLREVIALR